MISRKQKGVRGSGATRGPVATAIGAGLLLFAAIGIGVSFGIGALVGIWREQYRVEDRDLDVVITTGKMVHPDVITLRFGLTNGANLATIPFEDLRLKLLDRIPNIRDIQIERRLPNRVNIAVLEREPIARVAPPRGRAVSDRVADQEGVVFRFSSNTALLPIIHEADSTPTPPGKRLTGHAAAALRLVEVAAQPELADLRVLEINTSHKDYLFVTLGNYDRVKLAWDHMDEDSRLSRESLQRQLRHLQSVVNANITPRTTVWIATDFGKPSRIYASDPARNGNQQ